MSLLLLALLSCPAAAAPPTPAAESDSKQRQPPVDRLHEGWSRTIPIPYAALGEGDEYLVWVENGWLQVKRRTADGRTDWHIILARATDPTPPEILAIEGTLPFQVSYHQGRYFIRESGDMLRGVRQRKLADEGTLNADEIPADKQDDYKPAGTGTVQGFPLTDPPTVAGWLKCWVNGGWFHVAGGPDENRVDYRIKLNPHDRRKGGYTYQSSQGGLLRVFHGETWLIDDGEMLVATRTLEAVDRAERARKAVLENLVGSPAPPLTGTRWLNADAPITWDKLAGKVVLLDFWATWCLPCVKKLPDVAALRDKYEDRGLVVIGIHSSRNAEGFESFLKDREFEFPFFVASGDTAERYAISGYPTYILVDKTGKVATAPSNKLPAEEAIERLLDSK